MAKQTLGPWRNVGPGVMVMDDGREVELREVWVAALPFCYHELDSQGWN